MAIATQQATEATDKSASKVLGDMPSGRFGSTLLTAAARAAAEGWPDSGRSTDGARWRRANASGSRLSMQNNPTPTYVWRQPTSSTKCWMIGGHTAPDK